MYHDRVHIAMKLIGFDRGVTLISFLLPIRDMADAR
jgi:4-hydroxy-L-threonine phosphate dehydrogenase PdxA